MNENAFAVAFARLVVSVSLFCSGCACPKYLYSERADGIPKPTTIREMAEAEDVGDIHFLIVHGMGNHPFGKDGKQPQLGGFESYVELRKALDNWNTLNASKRNELVMLALESQSNELVASLAKELGHPVPGFIETDLASKYEFDVIKHPSIKRSIGYQFTRRFEGQANAPDLHFHVVNWEIAGVDLKEQAFGRWDELNGPVEGAPPSITQDTSRAVNDRRKWITKKLKLDIVDWGFGDAILSKRAEGEHYKRAVAEGLERMTAQLGEKDRVVLIASSLGSTILIDTLHDFLKDEEPFTPAALQQFTVTKSTTEGFRVEDMPLVQRKRAEKAGKRLMLTPVKPVEGPEAQPARWALYLFANQYGLLSLGTSHPTDNALQKDFEDLDDLVSKKKLEVDIVSFTDPNDILSFHLDPYSGKPVVNPPLRTTNVYVQNKSINILNLLHEPGSAHVGYGENPHVIRTMLDGPKDAD